MKCKLCDCEITEENEVCEDIKYEIHEKVDFYGLGCLTENEQVYLMTDEMCSDCI